METKKFGIEEEEKVKKLIEKNKKQEYSAVYSSSSFFELPQFKKDMSDEGIPYGTWWSNENWRYCVPGVAIEEIWEDGYSCIEVTVFSFPVERYTWEDTDEAVAKANKVYAKVYAEAKANGESDWDASFSAAWAAKPLMESNLKPDREHGTVLFQGWFQKK
jgi:hypothetical protein